MRIIAHFDMDAFFAAIEERDNERFRGLPIVVGADPRDGRGRGVVSTANYKAREYGIHSAQPISIAWKLAQSAKNTGKPAVIFLGVNMDKYRKVSEKVMAIMRQHIPKVEEASIDEAYGDLSFAGSYKKAETICKKIKTEIRKQEKLTVSVGIAHNKFISKIASGIEKPNGLVIIKEKEAEKFLEPLPVRAIPGVGPKTETVLIKEKVRTVKDLKRFSREEMIQLLGKLGATLYERARAIDRSPVKEEIILKSIGEEETFLEDSGDPNFVFERMMALVSAVYDRFQESGFKSFRTITVKIRFSDFETKNRAHTFLQPISNCEAIQLYTYRLTLPFFDKRENPRRKAIRLIGIRLEKLS
ncbi:MAG: DNA polymerase IV [Candidatus Colwellbacteria bacterium]|nr:DNA polymerase IV [Candidatus Colwellbacteria bacterium]